MHRTHLLTFLIALGALLPPAAPPARAQSSPAITVSPAALAESVPLGETRRVAVNLRAASPAQSLTLYEALAAPPARLAARPAPLRAPLPPQATRVDPRIRSAIAAAPDGRTEFLAFLGDQPDLAAAAATPGWAERGQAVADTLRAAAERSQRGVRALLEARGAPFRPFWIVNALAVRGTAADLAALDARPEIALIAASTPVSLPPDDAAAPNALAGCSPDLPDNDSPTCWPIRRVGADRAWRVWGDRGAGITLGSIDTGANWAHQSLVRSYRGTRPDGSVSHDYNWFDPQGRLFAPDDDNGHGTHTIGSMVGAGDSLDQPAIGVAPGARWIAAQGCERNNCTPADLLAAAQWMLAPTDLDGNNPRPDLRPQIVNNSWAGKGGDPWFAGAIVAWRAAGMFPVFAAGNTGPGCGTISSPADDPHVLAVGSTGLGDVASSFSGRGALNGAPIKPDISAPGDGVLSAYRGGPSSYAVLRGTSMASPHAAATVALLWSANPALIGDYDATYAILTGSAVPLRDTSCDTEPGPPNNTLGYGRLDAYAAVARARVDVPWLELPSSSVALDANGEGRIEVTLDAARVPGPGAYTARILVSAGDLGVDPLSLDVQMDVQPRSDQGVIAGSVRDAWTGVPLSASVSVAGGPAVAVDATGAYTLTLARRDAPYALTASATGYLSATAQVQLDTPALRVTQPFTLAAALPHIELATSELTTTLRFGQSAELLASVSNTGTRPLSYTVSVAAELFGVWRSDEPGGPSASWVTPAAPTALSLGDDDASYAIRLPFEFPLYGQRYSSIYVFANGLLGVFPPVSGAFAGGCLPIAGLAGPLIAPFHTDIDPSLGGTISYGMTAQGFVVSYEGVRLKGAPPDGPTYSFQAVLAPSGRIGFAYKSLGPLPRSLMVGVQRNSSEAQAVGCGAGSPVRDGLALELRPQPNPQFWLESLVQGVEVAPGQSAPLAAQAHWQRPSSDIGPLRGVLVLQTNDPARPLVRLTVTATSGPAPYELLFPLAGK